MTKFEQIKKALEKHFCNVSYRGNLFCVEHVHDGLFDQSFAALVGDLRVLSKARIELLVYDPRRQYVVFYGSEKHAKEVSLVMSKEMVLLSWEKCPFDPLYSAVDYFAGDRCFEGWDPYLCAISECF